MEKELIKKSDGKFIVLSENVDGFQRKIEEWLDDDYSITILHQNTTMHSGGMCIITASIIRRKL